MLRWLTFLLFLLPAPVWAEDFAGWLERFKADAAAAGISTRTLQALDTVEFKDRVIELDQNQPESTMTLDEYLEKTVTPARVEKGRALLAKHRGVLNRVAQRYGVQPAFIVALWGKESNFGANTGGFMVLDALATLAYEGRRADYFRSELVNALKIIDAGHIRAADMKGSWAGAMGQCQFMPTSFFNYGADGNGDRRIDIWNTEADVFASAANYLNSEGWNGGETWGREVVLTQPIRESLIGLDNEDSLDTWAQRGIRAAMGGGLPKGRALASLIQPDGPGTRAFLVYHNFRVLRHWNRSNYFSLSVGQLADAIGG
ncbi:MAG: lytic transglycosylase domain-containing protein [Bdellovibrionales bacterium]